MGLVIGVFKIIICNCKGVIKGDFGAGVAVGVEEGFDSSFRSQQKHDAMTQA